MRRVTLALALFLVAPGFGAAAIVRGLAPEQLVEGHTVWLTIDMYPNATATSGNDFAAAVAVLVQEELHSESFFASRFPGVLWFNDQYLVDAEESGRRQARTQTRYPCTGAVIAVNRGDPVDQDLEGRWTLVDPTYANESYLITDPNDRAWVVDLWTTVWDTRAWTVALLNNEAGAGTPDDGKCRGSSVRDLRLGVGRRSDPGSHGMDYPCDGCDGLRYNAVLYFRLAHLTAANATKDHRENTGADWFMDASGCHESDIENWDCPGGDDAREGNSHPYNPGVPAPTADVRRDLHGGSAPCPDGSDASCHATRDIDVYYGYVTPPRERTFVLVDIEGSASPYHCHASRDVCDPWAAV